MPRRPKHAAPDSFVQFLWDKMEERDISLNQLAAQAGVSPAFLSRILNRKRGLPSDKAILRLAEVLDVQPRERLLIEAGRIPEELRPTLNQPLIPELLRVAGPLSQADLQQVIKAAQSIALRKHRTKEQM